jgi:hypothetical protein
LKWIFLIHYECLLFLFLNLNFRNEINKIKIHPKQLPINPKTMVVKPSS